MGKKSIDSLKMFEQELKPIKWEMEGRKKYLQSTIYQLLPPNLEIDLPQRDLSVLQDIWTLWEGTSMQNEFRSKFGPIDQLLFIEVDLDLIQAILPFWDPEFRCFTFNEVDLAPTLEEYSTILEMNHKGYENIYFKTPIGEMKDRFAVILGQIDSQPEDIFRAEIGMPAFSREYLEGFIKKHKDEYWSLNAFALAIYGLVVFPKESGEIDLVTAQFFERVLNGANPIPVILAETLRSLNWCRKNGKGYFRGCLQLLYVWIRSHFECIDSKFDRTTILVRNVLVNFRDSTWPRKEDRDSWVDRLRHLGRDQVVWLAPWMRKKNVLYRCGKYPWVPLIGMTGVVGFAPIMFMRQVGTEQFAPDVPEMLSFDFDNSSPFAYKNTKAIRNAWKEQYWIIARWYTFMVSPEYERWIANRGKPVVKPRSNPHVLVKELTDTERLEEEFEKERWAAKRKLDECEKERDCALVNVRERNQAVERERLEHEATKTKLAESQAEIKDEKWRFLRMVDQRNELQEEMKEMRKDNQVLHIMYCESQEKVREKEQRIFQLRESNQKMQEMIKTLQVELEATRAETVEGANKRHKTI